ncbi:hypothetical protein DH2020_045829 [Rehmannia glutinosa]|uniref:Uncharacterized protein n=1 Tax=Rehmannia glutinosa TaxID=99300 RepID=A0ABR0UE02_REHGL
MASSDNLMTMEQPWFFRPTFTDAWASDIFTKETDTLTKALQMSFASTSSDGDAFSAEMVESLFAKPDMAPIQTPTASGCSENEPRRSQSRAGAASRRAAGQMVQQVTGVRFAGLNEQLPAAPVLKPEPHRVIDRLQIGRGLPTFDTSAYLLDGSASSLMSQPQTPYTVAADGGSSGNGLDFDSFCSFPTLESWKVM